MIPIDAPSPNPDGNSINQNNNDVRPTLGKTSPQIGIKKGLENNPIDTIMSRTPRHNLTTNTITQYQLAKIGPRGEMSICELLPILGADWFVWVAFMRLD